MFASYDGKNAKAYRIARATYFDVIDGYKFWVVEKGEKIDAMSRPSTDEIICVRTLNAIDKLIEGERRISKWELDKGFIDSAKYEENISILTIMQNTFDNYREWLAS